MELEDDNAEFEEQLRLERLEAEKKSDQSGNIKVDPDGTTYEWDEKLKAWFPKVDEDFLAQYQMSYGINNTDDEALQMNPTELEELRQSREQQWKDYYAKCEEIQQTKNGDDDDNANDATESRRLFEYYNSDAYREWYNKYIASQQTEGSQVSKSDNQSNETEKLSEEQAAANQSNAKRKRKVDSQPAAVWYELSEEKNTHVYVQNLPLDITDDEFIELMSKCGMLMYEPFSNKPRAKLYRDEQGNVKGDGRCCYIKIESVDLALQIIDGSQLRGNTLSVTRAKFQLKGDFDPQKRRKLTKKEKKKLKIHQENLFRWGPEKSRFDRAKRERALVLKNLFTIEMLDADALKLTEIRDRLNIEASNCGLVKRIVLHDNHPDGVATVWFSTAEEADTALAYFSKSIFYNGRVLSAEIWDGKTKYDVKESEEEKAKRLASWENYLEGGGDADSKSEPINSSSVPGEPSSNDEEDRRQHCVGQQSAAEDDAQNYSTDSECFEGDSDSDGENVS